MSCRTLINLQHIVLCLATKNI